MVAHSVITALFVMQVSTRAAATCAVVRTALIGAVLDTGNWAVLYDLPTAQYQAPHEPVHLVSQVRCYGRHK